MRGPGIEKAVEICATNITNKTECTSTHAKKWENSPEDGNRSSFQNVMFSRIPDDGKSPKTQ
jgi:hypothetical protein